MFYLNAPHVRELEVFTSMPDRYRRKGVQSVWADANQAGRPIDSFLEGPVFDAMGNLYVTDIPFGRIFKVTPKGDWDLVIEYDGEPNGMKFLGTQELLITDYKNGLLRLNLAEQKIRPLLARRNTESFRGLNDLTIASTGDIYFTDQGQSGLHDPVGRVYRLSRSQSGEVSKLDLLLSNVPSPNGIVLSPDEKILYVACTRGNCVWRMPLQLDGSVSKVGQFFTSYGTSGPDGLAMDTTGRLLVANPGLGYVWVVNARGEPDEVLHVPKIDGRLQNASLTNLVFGGEKRQSIFCTESSSASILTARMNVPGMKPIF